MANNSDLLRGMKAICNYINVSEATALKFYRELDMPMRKSGKNNKGEWLSSRKKLDKWTEDLFA